ncbi:MAG: ribosome biogenesis GTPase YlqF [Erysipelotrichaceae bacterium]|nr:ribosome biogenesis GTPase YlqF [Erysipelotrichaceae bacterium]
MNKNKTSINWFPGHMTKAKREMEASLKLVDMVIEIRDSRIPNSSSNPLLKQIIKNKPYLIILSKKDKADDIQTSRWVNYFKKDGISCVAVDLLKDDVIKIIKKEVHQIMKSWILKQKSRGINPRAIRVMVIGIPNVGKSTLINRIAKKKIAKTADKPGVTRSLQWIRLDKDIELLDTPGILWPKFDDEIIGLNLAVVGSINDQILDIEQISVYALKYILKNYPTNIIERYNVELDEDPYIMFERIGKARNLLKKGEIDIERVMILFINELRNDKLGKITWEKIDEEN